MFDLTDHQWSFVKIILSLLEAVDQVTTTLSGERYPGAYLCCLVCVRKQSLIKMTMSFCLESSASSLSSRFHLDALEMDSPIVLSAVLDPRFHKLSFLSESQQAKLLSTSAAGKH